MGKDALPHSAFLMEDWTPGQYYIFDMPVTGQEDRLQDLLSAAQDALQSNHTLLSAWGKEVAETLIARIPPFLATVRQLPPAKFVSQKPRAGYVYLLQSPTGAYKIGRTVDPQDRLKTFSVKLPFEVEYLCLIRAEDMYALEAELQGRFIDKHINGEWFALLPEDIEYIRGLANA